MSDAPELKQTPLHALHVASGARMVDFAGWHMPVQYTGLIDEHTAVRSSAGLFDVSHMGELFVSGPGALDLLQRLTCNNVARLEVGRAHYTGLMTPTGTFHDDMLVYRVDDDVYMLVLNAANAAKDIAWIREHVPASGVTLDDRSVDTALLALQGPHAAAILEPFVTSEVTDLRYYGLAQASVCGASCIVSRTGYTGEDGFEIYAPADAAAKIWAALLESGQPHGLQAVGLAARDTLRLEAKMALYGNDIDDTTTAFEADLGWIVKLKKGDFIGRDALVKQKADGITRKLIGFEMEGRAIARQGYPVVVDDREVGCVTSGTHAPSLKKSIGLTYLPIEHAAIGTPFGVAMRGRVEPAQVVATPFYKRPD